MCVSRLIEKKGTRGEKSRRGEESRGETPFFHIYRPTYLITYLSIDIIWTWSIIRYVYVTMYTSINTRVPFHSSIQRRMKMGRKEWLLPLSLSLSYSPLSSHFRSSPCSSLSLLSSLLDWVNDELIVCKYVCTRIVYVHIRMRETKCKTRLEMIY